MSTKKTKHNDDLPAQECQCEACSIRSEAFYHLDDTAKSLALLYAERFEVDHSIAEVSVVQGLVDVLADLVVTAALGMPNEKEIISSMVAAVRERMKEVREERIAEISESAPAPAEVN